MQDRLDGEPYLAWRETGLNAATQDVIFLASINRIWFMSDVSTISTQRKRSAILCLIISSVRNENLEFSTSSYRIFGIGTSLSSHIGIYVITGFFIGGTVSYTRGPHGCGHGITNMASN